MAGVLHILTRMNASISRAPRFSAIYIRSYFFVASLFARALPTMGLCRTDDSESVGSSLKYVEPHSIHDCSRLSSAVVHSRISTSLPPPLQPTKFWHPERTRRPTVYINTILSLEKGNSHTILGHRKRTKFHLHKLCGNVWLGDGKFLHGVII